MKRAPAAKALADLERLFKALGDTTRLRILGLLMTGEVCVCHIHESLKITQPKASRHLAYLRRAGLVDTRRDGLWVHYRLAAVPSPVLATIAAAVRHALLHVDAVRRDAERLHKQTGCCVPALDASPGAPCCAGTSRIGKLRDDEFDAVVRLLEDSHLPIDGLREHAATTLVARDNAAIVGSAALEVYSDGALLRSVAVAPGWRDRGIGRELTEAAIRQAEELHLPALFLLTTTAERYFPKFGFARIERGEVPPGVRSSVEFASACPSSASVMRKLL
jgi:amino-acid N-acetyltransferase